VLDNIYYRLYLSIVFILIAAAIYKNLFEIMEIMEINKNKLNVQIKMHKLKILQI
jgi:hypothetical protein